MVTQVSDERHTGEQSKSHLSAIHEANNLEISWLCITFLRVSLPPTSRIHCRTRPFGKWQNAAVEHEIILGD